MIVGQALDMAAHQPDVGNVIVHRAGDLLVLVDSGVTTAFRDAIRSAADDLAPWSKILLLTTHGHPDHVGNNDLVNDLGDGLDRSNVQHFVSAHDASQYRDDGLPYWITSLERVSGLVPGFEDPADAARRLLAMYRPYVPVTDVTRTYEELPLEHLVIGSQHVSVGRSETVPSRSSAPTATAPARSSSTFPGHDCCTCPTNRTGRAARCTTPTR